MGLVRNTFLGKRECWDLYLGRCSPCILSSLAHVGRTISLCPSTLCLFVLWLWLKYIMSLLAKVNIKLPFWWFWGDIKWLRELTQKWVLRLHLWGVISTFDLGWSHPLDLRFPYSCLKRGKRLREGRIVHEETFACERRSFWSLSMRFVAWGA